MEIYSEAESCTYELERCRKRIRELEEKIADLRMSRRVLMNLLEQAQNSRERQREQLTQENVRLHRQLSIYARRLWAQNGRLVIAKGGDGRESKASTGVERPTAFDRGI